MRYERSVRGADPAVIQSLPVVAFAATGGAGAGANADNLMCVVCREAFRDGDGVRVLPCFHRFHVTCIDPWLCLNKLCPVCHTNVHDAE